MGELAIRANLPSLLPSFGSGELEVRVPWRHRAWRYAASRDCLFGKQGREQMTRSTRRCWLVMAENMGCSI